MFIIYVGLDSERGAKIPWKLRRMFKVWCVRRYFNLFNGIEVSLASLYQWVPTWLMFEVSETVFYPQEYFSSNIFLIFFNIVFSVYVVSAAYFATHGKNWLPKGKVYFLRESNYSQWDWFNIPWGNSNELRLWSCKFSCQTRAQRRVHELQISSDGDDRMGRKPKP